MVFDGPPPSLKQRALRERAGQRAAAESRYRRIARRILAVRLQLLAKGALTTPAEEDSFENLENLQKRPRLEPSSDEDENIDIADNPEIARLDTTSSDFASLSLALRHELLSAKREYLFRHGRPHVTRPLSSLEYSKQQVDALVKRHQLSDQLLQLQNSSSCVLDIEKEIMESKRERYGKKIAADSERQFVLLKNPQGGWIFANKTEEVAEERNVVCKEEKKVARKEENVEDELFKDEFLIQQKFMQPSTEPDDVQVPLEKYERDFGNSVKVVEKDNVTAVLDDVIPVFDEPSWEASLPLVVQVEEKEIEVVEESPEDSEQELELSNTIDELMDPIIAVAPNKEERDAETTALVERLQQELVTLQADSVHVLSQTEGIEQELIEDFQELLTIVGIPWLRAAGEAEAQCVDLQQKGLVDAIISDDSDTLVFGGDHVYRHFFSSSKKLRVQLFRKADLKGAGYGEHQLLVAAVLLGCDYGPGVHGLGPKRLQDLLCTLDLRGDPYAGLEVVKNGLVNGIWPVDDSKLAKLSQQCAVAESAASIFNPEIIKAFQNPVVHHVDQFRWNMLQDLSALETFAKNKLLWTREEFRRIIDPLLRHRIQLRTHN